MNVLLPMKARRTCIISYKSKRLNPFMISNLVSVIFSAVLLILVWDTETKYSGFHLTCQLMEDSHYGLSGHPVPQTVVEQPWDHVNDTAPIQPQQMAAKTVTDQDSSWSFVL